MDAVVFLTKTDPELATLSQSISQMFQDARNWVPTAKKIDSATRVCFKFILERLTNRQDEVIKENGAFISKEYWYSKANTGFSYSSPLNQLPLEIQPLAKSAIDSLLSLDEQWVKELSLKCTLLDKDANLVEEKVFSII